VLDRFEMVYPLFPVLADFADEGVCENVAAVRTK
jgi:hypothetical protein